MDNCQRSFSPLILFVYNRPNHTLKTVEALKKNKYAKECDLYIFSDGPKNDIATEEVEKIRSYIKTIEGFKSVIIEESTENRGLAASVIYGVSKIINKFGRAIILEDDIVTNENFIDYMNKGLDFYKDNQKIWSVSAYSFPIKIPRRYKKGVYLSVRASSWGWATWQDRWQSVDWDVIDFTQLRRNIFKRFLFNLGGNDMFKMLKSQMNREIDSWAIRWSYSQFKSKTFTIVPVKSYVKNIGMDSSGTHCGTTQKYDAHYKHVDDEIIFTDDMRPNLCILYKYKRFMDTSNVRKIVVFLLEMIGLKEKIKVILKRK